MSSTASQARARAPRDAWLMLVILIIFYILNAFDRTILSLMVTFVKRDLHVTDTQIGMMLGIAFALFYGVFGLPIGGLVDRMSRRLILFVGVSFWSLATIACGFAGNFGQLLLARMALGIGEATLMPTAHSIIADKFPAVGRSTALSVFYLGGVLGNSMSVAIGGVAVAHFSQYPAIDLGALGSVRGWQAPFLIVGVLGVVIAGLAFAFKEPGRHQHGVNAAPKVPFSTVVWSRRAIVASIFGSFVLFSMVLYGVILWTPTYMTRAFGWSYSQIGPTYALVHILGAGAGTVLSGMLVDRLTARGIKDAHLRVLMGCLLIAAPCGIAAFLVPNPYAHLVLNGLFFFFGLNYSGYAAATVQAVSPPSARGKMAAVYLLMLIIVGSGLGPWVIGLITDHIYGSETKLGLSIVTMIVIIAPIAFLSAWYGLKPMRAAVTEVEDTAAAELAADKAMEEARST